MIDEYRLSLALKRKQMAHINQQSRRYDNTGSSCPIP
jgi:hypothetical protein